MASSGKRTGFRPHPIRALLLLPFIAVLWVPFYNTVAPALFGVPFFYWYQLLWILLTALVVGLVYRVETRAVTPE